MEMESEKVAMTDPPLIAYPPIKRIIKLEIEDEHQEVNSEVEEHLSLQVHY